MWTTWPRGCNSTAGSSLDLSRCFVPFKYLLRTHKSLTHPTQMSEKLDNPSSSSIDTGSGGAVGGNGVGHKAIIKNVDMTDEMQHESIEIALSALEKFAIEKDIAAQVKKEFDRRHGPTWHVVVGKNFGSYVTHETKHFIYFYVGPLAILIWKS